MSSLEKKILTHAQKRHELALLNEHQEHIMLTLYHLGTKEASGQLNYGIINRNIINLFFSNLNIKIVMDNTKNNLLNDQL